MNRHLKTLVRKHGYKETVRYNRRSRRLEIVSARYPAPRFDCLALRLDCSPAPAPFGLPCYLLILCLCSRGSEFCLWLWVTRMREPLTALFPLFLISSVLLCFLCGEPVKYYRAVRALSRFICWSPLSVQGHLVFWSQQS